MRRIRASRRPAVRAVTLDATFPAHGDGEALRAALDRLFADAEAEAEERRLQQAVLAVKGRFGKNALLRGTSLKEKATARERNEQIGGHHA